MAARPLDPKELRPHRDRFLTRVDRVGECWHWEGSSRHSGYGSLQINGQAIGAHRFAYTVWRGPIPKGQELDHLCRDRACVNPDHLELVTRAENLARRTATTPGAFSSWVPLLERIKSRLETPEDGCWLWTGALVRGYGVLSVNGRTQYVHREFWRQTVGPLAEDMTLDHLCRNTRCCRPDHLEIVTRSENAQRAIRFRPAATTCRRGHEYALYGRYKHGGCRACDRLRSGLPLTPYVLRRTNTATHCVKGHDYSEVGRYPSGGCKACQRQKDVARLKGAQPLRQFCPSGHDVFIVGRNPNNGECRACAREYVRNKYGYKRTREEIEIACRNGHARVPENTRYIKRKRNGKVYAERLCLDCRSIITRRYHQKKTKGVSNERS